MALTYSLGMPLPMTWAWREMAARMVASFAFGAEKGSGVGVRVAVLDGSSWMRERGPSGSLKACERRWWSVRWEKTVSRVRVRICEKGGESMRSAVSSRRRRREGEVEEGWVAVGEVEGGGVVVVVVVVVLVGSGASGEV